MLCVTLANNERNSLDLFGDLVYLVQSMYHALYLYGIELLVSTFDALCFCSLSSFLTAFMLVILLLFLFTFTYLSFSELVYVKITFGLFLEESDS